MMAAEVVWLLLLLAHELLPCPCAASALDRGQFPDSFLFGTSTSAYQVITHFLIKKIYGVYFVGLVCTWSF
jgi:hypothetical protein